VHQPYRIRHYTIFDSAVKHDYFDAKSGDRRSNEDVLKKVAEKSYIPTNQRLMKLLADNPKFKLSISITGTVIEQLEKWSPEALQSFKDLFATGRVEIVGETYHHSLAFFYNREEFERQVQMHKEKVQEVFGQTPAVFRNTELAYNNDLAHWADEAGYKGILSEGWDPVLEWRSSNFVYTPTHTKNIKLLMKNYKLSDDIAFRFSNKDWEEYPLTSDKFLDWLGQDQKATNFNLFMDYETFGEHQWAESGIFKFLEEMPKKWLKNEHHSFMTVSEVIDSNESVGEIDIPHTVTWADTERDLSAWLGNGMQSSSINALYSLGDKVMETEDWALIEDWRRLQTSDHFYYMCTKYFNDGDIHAYFSPYETPYEAYTNFMNAFRDMQTRLIAKGMQV
jgi:alpha-amylase